MGTAHGAIQAEVTLRGGERQTQIQDFKG